MRIVPNDLQARLDSGATTLCRCWRVRRLDGRVFGFTDHDVDVVIDGTTFAASSGLDSTAVQASAGLAVDNADVMGALTDAGVTEADVRAGRFDRAAIEQWLVDWERPDLRVLLFAGQFGEIRRADGAFEVELRGPTEALNSAVGRTIQRRCDRRLGDEKCRFDRNAPGFSASGEVTSVSGAETFVAADGLSSFRAGWFSAGSLTWTSGANTGMSCAVRADAALTDGAHRIELWARPGSAVAEGDRFRIYPGCDKSPEACRDKFANFLNFRGFPHLPGDDWVAAYPRSGEVHDGSSLGRG